MKESAVRCSESSTVRAWGGPGEKAVGRDKRALVKICERARSIARIVDVNRPCDIRHIGGGTAGKRAISHTRLRCGQQQPRTQLRGVRLRGVYGIRLTHLDRKSRRESGNALQLPPLRKPLGQAMERSIEGNGPHIAPQIREGHRG